MKSRWKSVRVGEASFARVALLQVLASMPDESFGWLVLKLAAVQGRTIWPDGLGGFAPGARASIEHAEAEAKKLLGGA